MANRPLVTIRRREIAFNASFVSMAGIDRCTHVSIFTKPESFKVGFKFHDGSDIEKSYTLTRDGGGRGRGRAVQVVAIMRRNKWLAAVSSNCRIVAKTKKASDWVRLQAHTIWKP